ncbi:MAG: dephospho-CoA kinase [Candidatus Izemoplasmatales bacterium]
MSKEVMALLVIGLTGGIASGKSLITEWFLKDSIPVIDADILYKELSKVGEVLYNKIIEAFPSCKDHDSFIDFNKLGQIVFSDEDQRRKLNQITHPEVIKAMNERIEVEKLRNTPYLVLSIPLLFEANMEGLCDRIITVYTSPETEVQRLMKRDHISLEYANRKISSQMSLEEKRKLSDYVIDNSESIEHTYSQYLSILKEITGGTTCH